MQTAEKVCKSVRLECPENFSLGDTLLSGQCFRWEHDGGGYSGIAFGKRVRISQQSGSVVIEGDDDAALWESYLDLDTDYDAIREEVTAFEPRLADAAAKCGGVHILRQDSWEALCSFIISQNNNIPRIRLIISRLCELCGIPAQGGGWAFPSAAKTAELTEEQLKGIGCGYRAGYLVSVSRAVASGEFALEPLYALPVEEVRQRLMALHGVGPKVADCVMLYGLHRLEAMPRDVWIKRALENDLKGTKLGESRYAGVAQQYIFEYIRAKGQDK